MYSDNHLRTLKPSQWINAPAIIIGVITIQYVLLALLALTKVIEFYCWHYEFGERTMVERKGVFNVERKELHYYRIKSIWVEEPLWMRIFGLSNVHIKSSDPYYPEVKLYAVKNGPAIRNELRMLVDMRRKEENVREFDMYNL